MKFTLQIESKHGEMGTPQHVAKALTEIADKIREWNFDAQKQHDPPLHLIRDENGHAVGTFRMTE